MFVAEIAIVLVCGIIGRTSAEDKLLINATYSSAHIKLTCSTKIGTGERFQIHLKCPFTDSEICFTDCSGNLTTDGNSLKQMITKCDIISTYDTYSVTYQINIAQVTVTGDWYCIYRGNKSIRIPISKYEIPTVETKTTTTVARKKYAVKTKEIFIGKQSKRIPRRTSAENKLLITSTYSSAHIKLTCSTKIETGERFQIHLKCPFTDSEMCFTDCDATDGNSLKQIITKCEKSSTYDTYSITYQINIAQVTVTGDWYCIYRGNKSIRIPISKYEIPTVETKTTTTVARKKYAVKTKEIFIGKQSKRIPTIEPSTTHQLNSTFESPVVTDHTNLNSPNWIIQNLTRPELVLALVVLLGFSLLLNLSFLIRCVLLKSVIDNYNLGIRNGSCLMGCLCIEQYSHRRKYSQSINYSNQVGSDLYRCQALSPDNLALYDDLSAVSNSSARVKLRSNPCSDLDEETMLTNLMPNGGSQINSINVGSVSTSLPRRYTSPSHAAYFHPGLGNYVIVSGPIPSHDQYTIGAAPPGYALQMVSPIPSAPGSITGGHGTNISLQSGNSDDLLDTDHSQTTNSIANQSIKQNNPSVDMIDANRMHDLSQTINFRVNGFPTNRQILINNPINYNRSNGSVPRHPWSMEKVPFPPSSSMTSLPQYSASENGIYVQDKNQIKDPLITS